MANTPLTSKQRAFSDPRMLIAELKKLSRAYVRLLEAGKDRIETYGGTCDSVEQMERGDPDLNSAKIAIEAAEIELRHVETSDRIDWKARAEAAEGILNHNMALANATTRKVMEERNAIIRKLRERHSAIEIAEQVGLTRQRVHQILNEAPIPPEEPTAGNHAPACAAHDGKLCTCGIHGVKQAKVHTPGCICVGCEDQRRVAQKASEKCLAAGCKNPGGFQGGALCKDHFGKLSPSLRGEENGSEPISNNDR